MALQSGDMVGPYRIVGQFGQGGMATVYKAYHSQLERNVAIKFLQQSYVDDVNFLTRFEREAKIIASLDHTNIVPIYDFNYFKGQPYLVMKSVEGVTLKEFMTDTSTSKSTILDMLTAVAAGLTYAHERHVLHRDIKPSNILVDSANRPYITDFGLARMTQASQSTLSQDMLMGTPHYMSPEQAKGTDDLGPATDIYSLGVILYEFAVGKVPFSGNTPYAIVHDHIYTPLPSPREINPTVNAEVEAVLIRALAKSPADRFTSAVEMLTAFNQAFTSGASVAEKRPTATKPPATANAPIPSYTVGATDPIQATPNDSSNSKWLVGVGLLVLILIIGVAAIVMKATSSPSQETPLPTLASLSSTTTSIPATLISTVDQLPTASAIAGNDGTAYLELARTAWQKNDNNKAEQAIRDGYQTVNDKITYLLAAASIAKDTQHLTASLFLDGQALYLAENDTSRYQAVRAEVGARLYSAAQTPDDINMRELERLNQSIPDFQQPDLFDIMTVQILVTQKRLPLAQAAYNRLSDATTRLPEAYLVHGELLLAQGNADKARKEWKEVLQVADTPQWVTDRVTELLKSN